MVRLSEVAAMMTDGDWIESKDQSPNGIRLLQVGNIGKGFYIDKSERAKYISEITFSNLKCTEVIEGDILISRLPDPVGRACIVPHHNIKLITAVDCTIIRLNSQLCNKHYLLHYLCSPQYFWQIEKYVVGTTRSRISRKNLQTISVPLPPLPVQQQIADVLDQANVLLEKRKAQIEKLDLLVKSRFLEMFGDPLTNPMGWETRPLFATLEAGSTVTYGIVQTGDNVKDGVPVFRPIDIVSGRIPLRSELKCTTKEISSKYKRTLLKGYELLITVRGSIGDTFQVTPEFEGCNVARNIVPLRIDTRYLLYPFMEGLFGQSATKQVIAELTKGIALQGLNMSEFREINIIIPPLELQNNFVNFVSAANKSKVEMQRGLDTLELLYKSLMQKCFSGEMF